MLGTAPMVFHIDNFINDTEFLLDTTRLGLQSFKYGKIVSPTILYTKPRSRVPYSTALELLADGTMAQYLISTGGARAILTPVL